MNGIRGGFFAFTIETLEPPLDVMFMFRMTVSGDVVVLWGDGTESVYTYPDPPGGEWKGHVYQNPGRYQIIVLGLIRNIGFGGYSLQTNQRQYGAERLISIDTPFPKITPRPYEVEETEISFTTSMGRCANLEKIHPKLFVNQKIPGIVCGSIEALFYRCAKLPNLPDELLTDLIFYGNLNLRYAFAGCSFTRLPDDLFSNPTLEVVTNAEHLFDGTRFERLPSGIFDYFINATNFSFCLAGCDNLRTVDPGLFSNCRSAQNFDFSFSDDTGIVSNVPELWNQFPSASSIGTFYNCINAANYDSIPQSWR